MAQTIIRIQFKWNLIEVEIECIYLLQTDQTEQDKDKSVQTK